MFSQKKCFINFRKAKDLISSPKYKRIGHTQIGKITDEAVGLKLSILIPMSVSIFYCLI